MSNATGTLPSDTQSNAPQGEPTPSNIPSGRTLTLALIVGVVSWLMACSVLRVSFTSHPDDWKDLYLIVPPLFAVLPLQVRLLRSGQLSVAVLFALVFPVTMLAQAALMALLRGAFEPAIAYKQLELGGDVVLAAFSASLWLAIGLDPFSWLRGEGAALRKRIERVFGLFELLMALLILGFFAQLSMPSGDGYSVRSRVSELILAATSAKTALSEGMQTTGSWSQTWMSSITISATGMVASATIGPTGQIIVEGTSVTSNSVLTLTPTVTTDNKLVWTCVGRPAKYMPASCR